jgi:kumamolisin
MPGGGVIAIVELGGGWVQSDMDSFFQSIGQPSPQITDVSVDGTENSPTRALARRATIRTTKLLSTSGLGRSLLCGTGKAATIRVYWSQDIGTAVQKATADGCDVCSISWGSDEANWGTTAAEQMESDGRRRQRQRA